jgi:hypothetical protein
VLPACGRHWEEPHGQCLPAVPCGKRLSLKIPFPYEIHSIPFYLRHPNLPISTDEIGGRIKSGLLSPEVEVMLGPPGFETKMMFVWSSAMISIAVHLPAEDMIPS